MLIFSRKNLSLLLLSTFLAGGCPTPEPKSPDYEPGAMCGGTLQMDSYSWRVAEGCTVDNLVSRMVGQLVYPCEGGEATATFGPYRFVGRARKKAIYLQYQTDSSFPGGCMGVIVQQISGDRDSDTFSFSYNEVPEEYGCAERCWASGRLRYTPDVGR